MTFIRFYRYSLLLSLALLFLIPAQAEVVYHLPPPARKAKHRDKASSRIKRFRKKAAPNRQKQGIVANLYLTFSLLFLLPILWGLGLAFILGSGGFGLLFWLGIGLLVLSNGATITAGILTGATPTYSTRALGTGVLFFFLLNLLGGLFILIYNSLLLGAIIPLTATGIGLLVIALIFLIWGAFIIHQGRDFRRGSKMVE